MTLPKTLAFAGLLTVCLSATSCVQTSGGAWMFRSAPTPEGWPETTPVGEVRVQEYPAYRAAIVVDTVPEGANEQAEEGESMFMQLFDHIREQDIAMTAPVEMTYRPRAYGIAADESQSMDSMAFLYRTRDLGDPGNDGAVRVRDVEAATFASLGVRGGYSIEAYEAGLATLETWLERNAETWEAVGTPRYLGYNSPFVLPFMRYGEVQVPVRRIETARAAAAAEAPVAQDAQ